MGSPLSAPITNFVKKCIEEQSPQLLVIHDDSRDTWTTAMGALRKITCKSFNIIWLPLTLTEEVEKDNRLSFLDKATNGVCGHIQVSVYRKPTHTDKYLSTPNHCYIKSTTVEGKT